MKRFKFLEHTADMKFQAFGKTLEESFENSALAMFNAMYDRKVKGKIKKTIKVKGKDLGSLLYNFLEEFLFLLDSENFVLSEIGNIKIKKVGECYGLSCEAKGDDAKNYKFNLDVKAITYNEMFVKKEKERKGKFKYVCQVVVDV